jgi:hypothetical protein
MEVLQRLYAKLSPTISGLRVATINQDTSSATSSPCTAYAWQAAESCK